MENGNLSGITLAEFARKSDGKYNTVWRKAKVNFPAETWSASSILSAEHIRVLSAGRKKKASAELPRKTEQLKSDKQENQNTLTRQPSEQAAEVAPPARQKTAAPKKNGRAWVLYFLLAAPTVASVHNMFAVTNDLSGNVFDAVALTVVLSVSALGFVWYGIREWHTIALALLLIAYEAFCNLARIYGGLMGIGTTGNPTRFMGLVTDIFGSGTHQTAIVLGGITALFLAAVQYAAIISINKTKSI